MGWEVIRLDAFSQRSLGKGVVSANRFGGGANQIPMPLPHRLEVHFLFPCARLFAGGIHFVLADAALQSLTRSPAVAMQLPSALTATRVCA